MFVYTQIDCSIFLKFSVYYYYKNGDENVEENFNINKKSFGKKIKEARSSRNLTQGELAEKIGISQNFLGDIERGIKLPSLSKLILISNTLKVSLDFLFSDSLDNIIYEPDETYYTDKQLNILKNIVKTIHNNF